jgi:hypothetical protein
LIAGGGTFSKKEKAVEDQYFRKREKEQLDHLKEHPEELEEELRDVKKRKDKDRKPQDKK